MSVRASSSPLTWFTSPKDQWMHIDVAIFWDADACALAGAWESIDLPPIDPTSLDCHVPTPPLSERLLARYNPNRTGGLFDVHARYQRGVP